MTNDSLDQFAPSMPKGSGKSVLILTGNDTQDLEFFYPFYRFTEAGLRVTVATPEGDALKCKMGMELQHTVSLKTLSSATFDLLYLPGGKAPASLRKNDTVIQFVQAFAATGKPIAAICHGPQILVTAKLISGKRISAWPGVEAEILEAGANYINAPLMEDGQFITARWPGDLPGHVKAALQKLGIADSLESRNAA